MIKTLTNFVTYLVLMGIMAVLIANFGIIGWLAGAVGFIGLRLWFEKPTSV